MVVGSKNGLHPQLRGAQRLQPFGTSNMRILNQCKASNFQMTCKPFAGNTSNKPQMNSPWMQSIFQKPSITRAHTQKCSAF